MVGLNAHEKPPHDIRAVFKKYQRATTSSLQTDADHFDPGSGKHDGFVESPAIQTALCMPDDISGPLKSFMSGGDAGCAVLPVRGYSHPELPGLHVFPSLIPERVQIALLDRMFHRDAMNLDHQSNLHLHYDMRYPHSPTASFFDESALDLVQTPKDPLVHKPIDVQGMMNKKLRWITLGGQYDWTAKVYPDTPPPPFPADIAGLIDGIFPSMRAEAAILNLYSPGDTLSLHRDVSEFCAAPLASISLGCDGIFIAGLGGDDGQPSRYATMRLRSGDVAVMSGEARFAWHGVPKILADTCPPWMSSWPCKDDDPVSQARFASWKGWMASKRINLNVRQMYARP